VLDNAEHLLPAVAPSIAQLVAVEGPTVLVTTRERLQLQGENVYDVGPLDDPDALRLFLARAAALGVSVERTDVVERLCHRLDNIPLALELAAARLRVFTPEQLLERLAARLDLLKGTRDADPRQQTLRATIDWSYNLLSPEEQRLFCRLSVFAGGATYAAAEAVSDADPDTLQSLIDKSLVRRRATETGPRFWMLETMRGYATEELERSGARESICERYADWVVGEVTRDVETHWGRTPEEWYTRVAAELDNVRAALNWLGATNDGERFARICIAMRGYWHLRGSSSEGAAHLERALTLTVPDRTRTGLLIGVSWLARDRMDVTRLRAAAEEVVEIAQRDGNHDAMVAGLRDLGVGDALAGDTELALSRWREALALAREHDLQGYLPGLTGNLAAAELQRRNWSAARTLSAEAAEFADQNGDAQVSAISRLNEGTATILDGEPAAARRPLVEALELSVGRGWTFVAHEVLDALAAVITADGDAERAARLMGAAQALREDGGLASEELEEEQRRITRGRLRETLGEAMFDDAFAAGRKLPLEEAAAAAQRV
jgi:predicted ATPase